MFHIMYRVLWHIMRPTGYSFWKYFKRVLWLDTQRGCLEERRKNFLQILATTLWNQICLLDFEVWIFVIEGSKPVLSESLPQGISYNPDQILPLWQKLTAEARQQNFPGSGWCHCVWTRQGLESLIMQGPNYSQRHFHRQVFPDLWGLEDKKSHECLL